jgi:hypothetical protein
MVQLAGGVTAVQVKPITLEDVAVAARPVGDDGSVVHGAGSVSALACAEAAEVPKESSASTMK